MRFMKGVNFGGLYYKLHGLGNSFEGKNLELNRSFHVDFELQIYQICDVWYPKKEPFIIENCDQESKDDDDDADDVLGMMFHSPKISDITFIVGNYKKEFKAHKKTSSRSVPKHYQN